MRWTSQRGGPHREVDLVEDHCEVDLVPGPNVPVPPQSGGAAVGFMSVSADVELEVLDQSFDLSAFGGLYRPSPDPHPAPLPDNPTEPAADQGGGVEDGGGEVCLSVCLSVRLSIGLSIYWSVCLSVYWSVCLLVCLSVSLSIGPSV